MGGYIAISFGHNIEPLSLQQGLGAEHQISMTNVPTFGIFVRAESEIHGRHLCCEFVHLQL